MQFLENKIQKLINDKNNLDYQANHDHLTNTLNRRAFISQAEAAFSLAIRHKEPLAIIMIDLDLFKNVNDEFGHHTGDKVLSIFSETIQSIIRTEDIFGRIGGEEFCLVFPRQTKEKAYLVSEKIRQLIANKVIHSKKRNFKQTISIGLSILTDKDKTLFDLQKRADQALYKAKKAGRNQLMFK